MKVELLIKYHQRKRNVKNLTMSHVTEETFIGKCPRGLLEIYYNFDLKKIHRYHHGPNVAKV